MWATYPPSTPNLFSASAEVPRKKKDFRSSRVATPASIKEQNKYGNFLETKKF